MNREAFADGRRSRRGFTLVELLIVVIILSILAAIVVPQFIGTSDDAKLATADTTLANMRAALDLYYQQHSEFPSALTDGDGGAADSATAFLTQLSQYTDASGDVALKKDGTHIYGPYLRKAKIPSELLTGSSALEIVTTGNLGMVAKSGDPGGWRFDNITGQFIINHSTWDDR